MIEASKLTQAEIRQLGIDTLTLALGPGGMGLFMHQFEMGNGDYTRDRDQILGNSTVTNIVERIKQRRTQLESSEVLPKVTDKKMIDVTKLTQAEIRRLGIEALTKALGPAGMARFMQQFELGSGDYTRDRDEILRNPSIEEIVAQIKQTSIEEIVAQIKQMRRQQQEQGEKF